MQIHLLAMPEMLPVPDNITVLADWEEVTIVTDSNRRITGQHIAVEGTEDAVKDWLRPFDGVWVGEGPPQFQMFNVMHIKE